MTLAHENEGSREDRLGRILAAYFEAAEADTPPDADEWLTRYREFAPELAAFFSAQRHVQRLAQAAPSSDADSPALSTAADEPASRERYTLTRLHATGGIGQVWLARDAELGREIALKELRPARTQQAAVAARFLEEARITGQLEHPGIVPVYELSRRTTDGQPFYTMRFVRGRTLREAITAYHEQRRRGQARPLEFAALLNAFVTVCQTVAYAHSRGVLHRDLKPQNVVLGDYGEVLVLDWGLAKIVGTDEEKNEVSVAVVREASRQDTADGQVLGTPAYMAPEQADGRLDLIDRRTDVYGLGAILYELLTGRPPFEGPEPFAVLKQVSEQAPLPPRRMVTETPPALEAVCLTALAKRREQRYEAAAALADEVRRFLADEPVRAYRDPISRRLGRWARRHRVTVAASVALLLTATAALAVGLVAVNHERAATAHANTDLAHANQSLVAEKARTRTAFDRMTSDVMDDILAKQPILTSGQKEFLEEALRSYEVFVRETGEDEESRAAVAAAFQRVASIRQRLGQLPEAEAACRRGQQCYRQLTADFPAVAAYRQELAQGTSQLGALLYASGHQQEAEREFAQAIALEEQLAAQFPTETAYRQDVAKSRQDRAIVLGKTGRLHEAEHEFRRARSAIEQLSAQFPTKPAYRHELAMTGLNLAGLLLDTSRPEEAEKEDRKVLALCQKLVADNPADPVFRLALAHAHHGLAVVLNRTERFTEAQQEFRQAAAGLERLVMNFPAVPEYRDNLAVTHHDLSDLFSRTGQTREAEQEAQRALAIWQQLFADFPDVVGYRDKLATSHHDLGNLLGSLGKTREAEAAYRQALSLYQALVDSFPRVQEYRQGLAEGHLNLGLLLFDTGQPDAAAKEYRRAIAGYTPLVADFPTVALYRQELASTRINLGLLLRAGGQARQAGEQFRQAVLLFQRLSTNLPTVPRYRDQLAKAYGDLCLVLAEAGQFKEAEQEGRKALPILQKLAADFPTVPEYREDLAKGHTLLGNLFHQTGRAREAADAYRQARTTFRLLSTTCPTVPGYRDSLAAVQWNLAIVLIGLGQPKEAEGELREALATERRLVVAFPSVPEYQYRLGGILGNLAVLLRRPRGTAAAVELLLEAVPHYQAALKSNPNHPAYRVSFRNSTDTLARCLLQLGRPEDAAVASERLMGLTVDPPNDYYHACCGFAICARMVMKDAKRSAADRQNRAQHYADRAMAALQKAVAAGYHDAARLTRGHDLDALRSRADFKKLLASLASPTAPKSTPATGKAPVGKGPPRP